MISRMNRSAKPVHRGSTLEELESTRVDLIEIYAMLLRKLGEAQSAQWLAATSGFGIDTIVPMGDRAAALSPGQLASSVRQYESEVTHVQEVIARLDARLAQAAR